jgi:hypothetical protein
MKQVDFFFSNGAGGLRAISFKVDKQVEKWYLLL